MAKKIDSKFTKNFLLIAAIMGVYAILMIFVPVIVTKDGGSGAFTGWQATFGYSTTRENLLGQLVTSIYLEFSVMNLITYVLAATGVVFALLGMIGKGSKFAAFIACGAFVVAGVFFFLQVAYMVPGSTLTTLWEEGATASTYYSIGAGAIISAVSSILAGGACAAKALIK